MTARHEAPDPWKDVSAARLPAAHLAALAPVRADGTVRVHASGDVVWVVWPVGRASVVRCLLPVPGVVFFTRRGGDWFRFGSRLPASDTPPEGDGRPVASVLFPGQFEPIPPATPEAPPVVVRIVRGGSPEPVTALACSLTDLAKWADTATTAELAAVRASRSGGRAVLLGDKLPVIPAAVRYWGRDLLVPVGFRPDPDLPPAALSAAVGAAPGELVLLDESGADVIPRAAFEPLTRAGVRLALRELVAGGEPS
jgi:hypothetical protein